MALEVELNNVGKAFFYRWIFAGVSVRWTTGDVVGIVGRNGSGKSTLLRLIVGLLAPSAGTITIRYETKELYPDLLHPYLGFVAPSMQLYTELTPMEHLRLAARLRGLPFEGAVARQWLEHFGIVHVADRLLSTFSSGMLQRFRLAMAMVHSPPLLCLDEPATNLDQEGREQLQDAIRQRRQHALVLIASNEPADLQQCTELFSIEQYHCDRPVESL